MDLYDAGDIKKTIVDWWPLFESGMAEFFQGEPTKPDCYLLPEFSEDRICPVGMLGVCIIHHVRKNFWGLAPARQQIDAWEMAAAYVRLGYSPPFFLLGQLTHRPRIAVKESREILGVFRNSIHRRQVRLNELSKVLLHINSGLE